ncbi:restriction endonuclease subunit S [Leuconostoc pseudomesenteroides]|uniref:restriction endonuclease subunit S n=1 Tax=Leuconostoc pseudomesenteroides TaxID=33968 RepID=UPI0039E87167
MYCFVLPWEQRKLSNISERVTRKNKNNESTLPLTISAQDGLVDQNDFFNKQVASRDVTGYFLVKNGEFAYNKSYSNGYPWGAIKRLDKYDMGVLSTLYIVFRPTDINSQFLVSYYDTTRWYREVSKNAAEGARNHGLLNIAPTDFFNTLLIVPKLVDEQEKIGAFFKQLDNSITQNEQKTRLLRQLKQAYLQKIFSQELRFAGFSDTWEQRKIEELGDVVRTGINPQNYLKEQFAEYSMPAYDDGQRPQIVLGSSMQSSRLTISGSVLLINKLNVRQKRVWLVSNPLENSVASGEFMPFTSSNVDLSFMRQLILSDKTTRDFEAMSSGTSNSQKRITPTDFLNYVISVPASKIEQTRIGGIFDEMDKLITLHQKKLNLLKQQKQAYLQKMFI